MIKSARLAAVPGFLVPVALIDMLIGFVFYPIVPVFDAYRGAERIDARTGRVR